MAFDFGMLSGLLPGGQTALPPSYGFDGPPQQYNEQEMMRQAAEAAAARLRSGTVKPLPPFGPYPGVPLPGMQGDLEPTQAQAPPAGASSGGGLPPWLAESVSAPVGVGGPANAPTPQPRPAAAPADDALPPNATPTTGPGAPLSLAPPAQPPTSGAPPTPGLFDRLSAASHNLSAKPGLPGIFDAISGLQSGQRLDPTGRQIQVQNQTFAALVKRGMDPDMASAVIANPEMMKQIIPSLFGGKKLMNVNGVLVDEATGKQVADYSEAGAFKPTTVKDPDTGLEKTVLYQASTGAIKEIPYKGLPVTNGQGGPASARLTLPPEVRNMPPSLQFKNAPDGSTATIAGRPVIKRAGRWEYVQ